MPGKDVAQALGLVITEEYELVTLDGLVVSFKQQQHIIIRLYLITPKNI